MGIPGMGAVIWGSGVCEVTVGFDTELAFEALAGLGAPVGSIGARNTQLNFPSIGWPS